MKFAFELVLGGLVFSAAEHVLNFNLFALVVGGVKSVVGLFKKAPATTTPAK